MDIHIHFEPALCIAMLELLVYLIKIRIRHNAKKGNRKASSRTRSFSEYK